MGKIELTIPEFWGLAKGSATLLLRPVTDERLQGALDVFEESVFPSWTPMRVAFIDLTCPWGHAGNTLGVHIPLQKADCPLRLRIIEVRALRTRELDSRDALAAGAPAFDGCDFPDPVGALIERFDAQHGAGAYESNPWVWAVSVEVLP